MAYCACIALLRVCILAAMFWFGGIYFWERSKGDEEEEEEEEEEDWRVLGIVWRLTRFALCILFVSTCVFVVIVMEQEGPTPF
jgi:hypothetical protein